MTLDITMPFYGRVDHFRSAVESVLRQTDQDWRLIVVDDVYPDESAGRWLEGLGDPRIEYHRNSVNLGVSGNFNACIDRMTGEFGVIFGCDDVMLPNYVARVRELTLTYPKADLFQPGVSVIDENGDPSRPLSDRIKSIVRPRGVMPMRLDGEELATSLLRGNWCYFPSLTWRTSRLKQFRFREDRTVVQDLTLILQIVFDDGSLVLDDVAAFAYRRHSGSVSSKGGIDGSKFAEERDVFYEAAEASDAVGWRKAASAARRHTTSRLSALSELPAALRSGDRTGRTAMLRHAFGGRG